MPFLPMVAMTLGMLLSIPEPGYAARPNVVLIMTDDQGYGDLAALGNPHIRTPHMDRLHAQSVRLTDFHVDPTCSPTRSALMTGRYSTRTGVWHTILGRSMMSPEELTLGEVFQANGYKTGIFGKWHLGDNYPLRPQDQGFDTCAVHGGGGVGQTPDWWGNDYFDDTYWIDGTPREFEGYCTDIWFDQATKFVEANRERPFFCYIPTNAPHGPYLVADEYSDPYRKMGLPMSTSKFYGMITNIDENLGRFRAKLDELGLTENTLFIFTTDNGSSDGRFNAGMRGLKGSEYDGGHRVPCFVYWPKGKLTGGRDVDQLCAHIDVMPTLIDLCDLKKPEGPPVDGESLKDVLEGRASRDRTLLVHSQRLSYPEKWRKSAVMTKQWRLINGKELYDIQADPGQKQDRATDHPERVEELRKVYEGWWKSLEPAFEGYVRIGLGGAENPARLTCHDWHCEKERDCPWNQRMIRNGHVGNGFWAVEVEKEGTYEIVLTDRPWPLDQAMNCTHARFRLGEVEGEQKLKPQNIEATFRVTLPKGPARFQTWLKREDGKEVGAYFAYVRLVEAEEPTRFEGTWEGPLPVGGAELRLAFKIHRTKTDTLAGTLDSVDQGVKDLPIAELITDQNELTLKFTALKAEYVGNITDDGQHIKGTWSQSGLKFPLELKRVEKVTELVRPQTPRPPFPYVVEEVTFPSTQEGVTLAGTLTLPKGEEPFIAAVLVSGSGPQDRDETLFGHKPFAVLADHLTRHGVAVLRYDDRGCFKSTGTFESATTADFAKDAEGAVAFLRKDMRIDPARIGIIGHSEGGLIAGLVAAQDPKLGFVVMLAGPGLIGVEVVRTQTRAILNASGEDQETLDLHSELQAKLLNVAIGDRTAEEKKTAIRGLIEEFWNGVPKDIKEKTDLELLGPHEGAADRLIEPWILWYLKFDPGATFQQIRCPTLALIGEKDLQVLPRENLDAIRAAFHAGDNDHLTAEVLPGLNHLFQKCETGLPKEYGKIEETFDPATLEKIAVWIKP